MAKYIFKMQDLVEGEMYASVLDNNFYLFLNKENMPTDEAKTHIEEEYKGLIAPGIKLGHYRLKTKNRIIKEGWGLMRKGSPYFPEDFYSYFPVDNLRIKCNEIIQSIREYETIIEVGLNYAHTNRLQAGWGTDKCGYFSIDMNYKLYRKSPVLKKEGYRDAPTHDYFNIPKDEDIETYIPTVKDKTTLNRFAQSTYREIPYSRDRLKTLMMITASGNELGKQLNSLLNEKQLELKGSPLAMIADMTGRR